MSDYVKSTDFASKDTLPSGDSAKIVRGTEIDAEFEALEVAIASKANTSDVSSTYAPLNSPTFTGSPVLPTGTTAVTQAAGDNDTSVATTAFVTTAVATAIAATKGPAFSAYLSSNQSITSNVATKVAFNAELFDTVSCFDTTTNYRFTPTVAGYYQINGGLNAASSTTATRVYGMIYKNGSLYIQGSDASPVTGGTCSTASAVVYLNGSTDYVEFYALIVAAAASIFGSSSTYTYFSGALVRGA